jgi:hypothetical protein
MSTDLNINSPIFGFHTKWSSDGSRIMFIIRTYEFGSLKIQILKWLYYSMFPFFKKKVRLSKTSFLVIDIGYNILLHYTQTAVILSGIFLGLPSQFLDLNTS